MSNPQIKLSGRVEPGEQCNHELPQPCVAGSITKITVKGGKINAELLNENGDIKDHKENINNSSSLKIPDNSTKENKYTVRITGVSQGTSTYELSENIFWGDKMV